VAGEPQTAKKADGQYPQYVGDRQYMVAGEPQAAFPQAAKKAAKRSPTELEKGEIKRQRMGEEEEELEEEEDFDSEEEDFEDESDEEDYSEYEQGFQEEPEEDLDGRGCGKPCCLNRLEAMAAMAAEMAANGGKIPGQEGVPPQEIQLEDFGGEQIPDCCQEQIKLLLDDQLNGDEGKTLKDCCTGIWSGFRKFGFRWYKFRLFKQVYAPNGVKEKACETLGVPMTATEDEIKRAYLKLARRLHPDKNPNQSEEDGAQFKKILQAYETLVGKR